MTFNRFRQIGRATLTICLAVLIVFGAGSGAFASGYILVSQWTLRATGTGLTLTAVNPVGAANLFDINRMTPGDRLRSRINVENNLVNTGGTAVPFSLRIEVEHIGTDADSLRLANQLNITVGGVPLTSQFTAGSRRHTVHTIATVPPGNSIGFDITVELPGGTDNWYQTRNTNLRWIFTATAQQPPPNPPNPPPGGSNNNGGGGGGGSSGRTGTDWTIPTRGDFITINPPRTPLADIEPGRVPMGQLPATGESPLWHSVLAGMGLIALGLGLLTRRMRRI